jgi:hypothetical protein
LSDRARRLAIERSDKPVRLAWTEAEDGEIRAGVAAGKTTKEIAKKLPGRTPGAVECRRTALLKDERPVVERWTEAEDAALREGFESGKRWKEIAEGVPGRTEKAARSRVLRGLGPKREAAAGSA